MKALFLVVVLAAVAGSAYSVSTCEECYNDFNGSTDKCNATVTAATCLLAGTDATCTGDSAKTAEKQLKDGTNTVYNIAKTQNCSTGITDLCSCQGQYATKVASRTNITSNETKCNEAKDYKTCVVGKDAAMKACDGTKTQPDIQTEAEAKVTELCSSFAVGLKSTLMIIFVSQFIVFWKV